MLLFLSLLIPPAHAVAPDAGKPVPSADLGKPVPKADVQRAIRVIQAAPNADVFGPTPTKFPVDMTTNPPTYGTFTVSGRGIRIEGCPGYPDAIIAYFSDPTNTVRVLTVRTDVENRLELVSDGNLDGVPDQAILEGANPALKELGRDEQIAYTMVVLCAGALETK